MILCQVFACLLLATISFGAPVEDLVVDLPGLSYVTNYNQYSGYLNGTTGRKLHYWFVESQNDPTTDPLVLWLNGGPGCSSLDGLLTENGPFRVQSDGVTLVENIYSWNTVANVLYLESPACVGFSYDDNNNCATDDDEVSLINYLALQEFMSKFPEYSSHDFYITGESYAGIYIPTLSVRVVDGQDTFPINFLGYAIGNGITSYANNQNSLMFYGYYHSVLGQDLWDNLVNTCCNGVESQATCDFYTSVTPACELNILKATDVLYYQGLNMYNLLGECQTVGGAIAPINSRYTFELMNLFRNLKTSRPEPYLDPPCIDSAKEMAWINQPTVRSALHIPAFVQDWEICSGDVNSNYGRVYFSVLSQLSYLQTKVRGLIYNGDLDMAVNFLGNQWDVESLGLNVTASFSKWTADNDHAGWVKRFDNLDFLIVRGAGHMVPTDKPLQALQMITAFLNNLPY